MYRPDLKQYYYYSFPVKAIGWLEAPHEYPKGKVPPEFFNKLSFWCSEPYKYGVNFTRGFHEPTIEKHPESESWYADDVYNTGNKFAGDNGEIHVRYKGVHYAAPMMICTYVYSFGYLPPKEFMDAVVHGELMDKEKFSALEHKYEQKQKTASAASSPDISFKVERHMKQCEHHLQNDEQAAAEREVEAALRLNPNDIKALFYQARISFDHADYKKAEKSIDKLMDMRPGLEVGQAMRGLIYFHLKKYKEAKEDLLYVLPNMRKNPGNNLAQTLYFLGKIASKNKRFAEAKNYFKESLQINPDDQEIKRSLIYTKPLAFISSRTWEKKKS
ncbi:MAG: tetratricopeptide repeat protein [Bacteroidia bacterium]|nr:tetratricopeptide repeat protein [Bacteroidia bacterium]